ncbi:MAG: lysophospholipid acyltransferase family protein [Propionibacteriaceae bacterium]|nr:lysophospholipid acyltransferase family protein [Propionibacteriaceae bacterium]
MAEGPNLLNPLAWRLEYQVAGLGALDGLDAPVILACNEQGVLDWRVLQAALPARLYATSGRPQRALGRGRSVVIFSESAGPAGGVGEFSELPAELANLYNVPVVPVAMVGTYHLNEVLRLALRRRPKVSVRFGSPIYVRGQSLTEATAEIQAAVAALFNRGDLSWWALQHRGPVTGEAQPMSRWRRRWQQSAPRGSQQSGIWCR